MVDGCPRYSDATDCGTLCSEAHVSPPPPSCELRQWAATASASSVFSRLYGAAQATGPPSHHITCAAGLAGSWTPELRDKAANWLEVGFATHSQVYSLRIWEHANPATAAGFVESVDLLDEDLNWINGVWVLAAGADTTVCGGTLTLYAADALTPLDGIFIRGARINTRTHAEPGWEYIDALQLHGSVCVNGTIMAYPRAPPPGPRDPPRPQPLPPLPLLPPRPSSPPPSAPWPRGYAGYRKLNSMSVTPLLGIVISGIFIAAIYGTLAARRRQARQQQQRVSDAVMVAQAFELEAPQPPSVASAAAQADLRLQRAHDATHHVLLAR